MTNGRTLTIAQPSAEFIQAIHTAEQRARGAPDDAVRYMVDHIPVYAIYKPDDQMQRAAGCMTCIVLGLWVAEWPTVANSLHGSIFLYEQGIRRMGGDLTDQTYQVLIHEFGHALQRDHVLDAMERQGLVARGSLLNTGQPQGRPCGCGKHS